MNDQSVPSYSVLARIVLAIAVILLAIQTIDYINFTVDDVFISMRVAENAAAGQGYVYNKGENVEGFSDPLWVWMLTGAARLGINRSMSPLALMWFAKALSYFFGLCSLFMVYLLAKKIFVGNPRAYFYSAIAVLFGVMCAPFVAWSCGGLEMTLVAFLFTFAVLHVHNIFELMRNGQQVPALQYIAVSGSLLTASLARPEPLLFATVGFIAIHLLLPKTEKMRFVTIAVAPYLLGMALFFVWRWTTYHDILPNTFYAKTGGGIRSYMMGVKYLLGALGSVAAPLLIVMVFAFRPGWRKDQFFVFMMAILATSGFFIIYSSGDWMPGARFLIPIAPMLFIIATMGIERIRENFPDSGSGRQLSLISYVFIIGLVSFCCSFAGRVSLRGESPTLRTGFSEQTGNALPGHTQVAEWLRKNSSGTYSVAAGEAGIIGYMNPNMRLIDLNGLMDRHIASIRKNSAPFDTKYVLDEKPDFVILYGVSDLATKRVNMGISGNYVGAFMKESRFLSEYSVVQHFLDFDIYKRNAK